MKSPCESTPVKRRSSSFNGAEFYKLYISSHTVVDESNRCGLFLPESVSNILLHVISYVVFLIVISEH